jgi:hypothetical protein
MNTRAKSLLLALLLLLATNAETNHAVAAQQKDSATKEGGKSGAPAFALAATDPQGCSPRLPADRVEIPASSEILEKHPLHM